MYKNHNVHYHHNEHLLLTGYRRHHVIMKYILHHFYGCYYRKTYMIEFRYPIKLNQKRAPQQDLYLDPYSSSQLADSSNSN